MNNKSEFVGIKTNYNLFKSHSLIKTKNKTTGTSDGLLRLGNRDSNYSFTMQISIRIVLFAKNSPPDCFLNAQTLPGSNPITYQKTKIKPPDISDGLLWLGNRDSNYSFTMRISIRIVLFTKNSPPDCFLNAQTLPGSNPINLSKNKK